MTTIGLLAAISGFHSVQPTVATVPTVPAPKVVTIDAREPQSVREAVEEYFADIPLMVRVAQCESRFRHLGKDGTIIRGEINPDDVGVMQINEHFHLESSQKLGYDIYTIEGNMAYARYLYEREGARPWISSSHCWGKAELARR